MNRYIIYCFLILLGISASSFAEDLIDNYWQCTAHDAIKNQWTSKSIYQKIALNFAYAECKKNSKFPATCQASRARCAKFVAGVNIMPMWRCTAFDREALAWRSNPYPNREDAALAANAYCKQKSSIPATCNINLITCINKGGGI